MQTAELPTKIYEPKPTNQERITVLAQSDAPIKIYEPRGNGIPPLQTAKGI